MDPDEAIAALDGYLDEVGFDIVFTRVGGALPVTAKGRYAESKKPDHEVSGTYSDEVNIIVSPTPFLATPVWITGAVEPPAVSTRNLLLPQKGDAMNIGGRAWAVSSCVTQWFGNTPVRIDITSKGATGGV